MVSVDDGVWRSRRSDAGCQLGTGGRVPCTASQDTTVLKLDIHSDMLLYLHTTQQLHSPRSFTLYAATQLDPVTLNILAKHPREIQLSSVQSLQ